MDPALILVIVLHAFIPFSGAVIGWGTNVLAIKMLFAPLDWRGVGPLGWQGIIPARAPKMARICVDLMLGRLLDPDELFTRLDPAKVADAMRPALEARGDAIIDEVVEAHFPRLWNVVPAALKERAKARVRERFPQLVEDMMVSVHRDLATYLDVRALVVNAFVRDRRLLNELFWRCGAAEFRFIARSGLVIGGILGLLQMLVWLIVQPIWFLPLGGLIVGWATNWLALQMIFRPESPTKVGPFVLQGLFLKRQEAVAAEYAGLFAREILDPRSLVDAVLRGPASDRLYGMVHGHLMEAIDDSVGRSSAVIELAVGGDQWKAMKTAIAERLTAALPESLESIHDYAGEALAVEESLRNRLVELPPKEFVSVLRPVFEEDEWILIALGAALGALAGAAQVGLFALA